MVTNDDLYPPEKSRRRPSQKIGGHEIRAGSYDILLMLLRIVADHDGAPGRCRNRLCRGRTRCMAGFRTPDRPACDVPLTRVGEKMLDVALDFLIALGRGGRR